MPAYDQSASGFLKTYARKFFEFKSSVAWGCGALLLPAVWITKVHMDWKPKPDSKKRMMIAHAGFWTGMFGGINALHTALFTLGPNRKWILPPGLFALAQDALLSSGKRMQALSHLGVIGAGLGGIIALPALGFEGGLRLGKILIPKVPAAPTENPNVFNALSMSYRQPLGTVNASPAVPAPQVFQYAITASPSANFSLPSRSAAGYPQATPYLVSPVYNRPALFR